MSGVGTRRACCRTFREAWPERPAPQGQERETMSGVGTRRACCRTFREAWPERPAPQGQERER